MPNVMAALPNIGGILDSFSDDHATAQLSSIKSWPKVSKWTT